jgi:hypothetical protein
MNFFRFPVPKGKFFIEIFLNYLKNPCSFIFFINNTCFWNHKEQEKGWIYFSSLFLCTVGSGIRDENFWDPGSGMKNSGIRIHNTARPTLCCTLNLIWLCVLCRAGHSLLFTLFAIPLLQCTISLSLLRYFSEFCNTLFAIRYFLWQVWWAL